METKQARIAIVGGGFGGLFTALGLSGAGHVTLISDRDHFTFRPMLYEYLSGEVEAWHIAPHYRELIDDRIHFINGKVTDIDLNAREIQVEGRAAPTAYDVLVLAVGGVTNYWGIEGAEEHTMPFREIAHADSLRQRMIEALDHVPPDAAPQDARRALTFAIVGGGASGVELSTKMADLLQDAFSRRALQGEPRVLIVEMGKQIVPEMDNEIRDYVLKALKESRVEVHTETRVVRVTPDGFVFEHNGEQTEQQAAAVVWVAGVRINPLVDRLDLEKNRRGLIEIEPTLQARSRAEVFVLGDITQYPDVAQSLSGTAQLAFQEAALAEHNIKAFLQGKPLKSRRFEELGEAVSLGTERAALVAEGHLVSGALARQARFALYTSRLPTWQHRLRVGASWFFGGTTPRPLQPLGIQKQG